MACNCNHCKQKEGEESFFKSEKGERILLIIRMFLSLLLVLLASYVPTINNNLSAKLSLVIIGYIIIAYSVFIEGFKAILHGQIFDEHFLMIIGTVGAMAISYFDEAIFVMVFYHVGEILEDYAEDKSKRSIAKLVNDMPLLAHKIIVDNKIVEVNPEDLKINDVILVKPGEKIPVDGLVISGSSSLNMSSLTGESIPNNVSKNSKVFSGSINMEGSLTIKVEKIFKDSTLSQILDLINSEEDKKSKSERFITKFSKFYTPIVVIAAIILFLTKYGLAGWGNNYMGALYDACTLLIISCPCALVVSVPLCFFLSIGRASRFGVLVKGSSAVENISKCQTFIFDKTGTLTKGDFEVISYKDYESLKILASLENSSTHPIAKSIVKKAQSLNIKDFYEVSGFKNIDGKGIKGKINGKEYIAGDQDYIRTVVNKDYQFIDTPYKTIYLACEEKVIGYVVISDVIKSSAYSLVAGIKNLCRPELIILSGDNSKIVENVKNELKFTEAFGQLLPQEKLNKIEEIKNEHKIVSFVGDGVNDAPSLLASNVGIAMGGLGSDAAKQSADIVILNDDLNKITETKRLAKKTMLVVIENIVIILAIKLAIFIIVSLDIEAIKFFQMYLAVVADVGTLIVSILNSLRVYYFKDKNLLN